MGGVVRALADRELLVVLDNCEHVLGSAGRVVVMLASIARSAGTRGTRPTRPFGG